MRPEGAPWLVGASTDRLVNSLSPKLLIHAGVPVSEGVGEARKAFLAAGSFDVDLRAYEFFFRRALEGENVTGGVDDAATAEVVITDAVGAVDEEAVCVGVRVCVYG